MECIMADIVCENTVCALCGSTMSKVEACGHDSQYQTSIVKFCFVECTNCGHIYLNPRPTSEELAFIYPDNYYTKDSRHAGFIVSLMKKIVIKRRLAFCKTVFKKNAAILECGCGDCSLLIDIKTRYPWCHVKGVDVSISPEAINNCRSLNIDLIQENIEDMDFGEEVYDLIIMNQLIEHLHNPVVVIEKMKQALKPGRLISIETPDLDGYDRKIFQKSFWGGYYFPRHMHLFSSASLRELFEKHGFKVLRQVSLVAPIIWIFSLFNAFVHVFPALQRPDSLFPRLFSDRNPLALGFVTIIDLVALLFGVPTSNQKIIVQKP